MLVPGSRGMPKCHGVTTGDSKTMPQTSPQSKPQAIQDIPKGATIVLVVCVVCVAAIEVTALFLGVNGTLMSGTLAVIGAIAGYVGRLFKESKEKNP